MTSTARKIENSRRKALISDDQIRAWAIKEGGEKGLSLNWRPIYQVPQSAAPQILSAYAANPSFPGVLAAGDSFLIDFSRITDNRMLAIFSEMCEAHWRGVNDAIKSDWLQEAKKAGKDEKEAELEFQRWLSKSDLYYLAKYVLGYDKMVFHLHYFMAQTVQDLKPGSRELREFCRDAFKSTVMNISYAVQQILRDPGKRILFISNKKGNASNKLEECKNHFIKEGTILGTLFPEYVPKRKSDEGSGTKWSSPAYTRVQKEGNFTAAGVKESLESQHYDIILGDDVWDENSVGSDETMKTCRKRLAGLEYILATPNEGIILLIGTRFAHDDPTKSFQDNIEYHCVIVSGILPCGRSAFPESLTLRKFYGQAHSERYVFSCQIMLNPTTEDMAFKREWFQYRTAQELYKMVANGSRSIKKRILFDAAGTNTQTADHVAIGVVAVDNEGDFTLIEYDRAKMSPKALLDRLFALFDKHYRDVEGVYGQAAPIEVALASFIDAKNKARVKAKKRIVPFYKISLHKQSKIFRMAALQPRFEEGEVYFDPQIKDLPALENQILQFPNNSSEDDGMDMLSMINDPMVSRKPPHTAKVSEPQEELPSREGFSEFELAQKHASARAAFKKMRDPVVEDDEPGSICA